MIIAKYNTIFIHTPRTGGTSIERMFGYEGGTDTYDETKGMNQDHRTAAQMKHSYSDLWDHCFKFGFVRNPWDKMVSMYLYRLHSPFYQTQVHEYENHYRETRGEDVPFRTWLKRLKWVGGVSVRARGCYNQLEYFKSENGNIIVDHIARFENFAEEWEFIKEKMGCTEDLIHLNRGHIQKYDYRDFYDDNTKAVIEGRFADDIEHFGYEF